MGTKSKTKPQVLSIGAFLYRMRAAENPTSFSQNAADALDRAGRRVLGGRKLFDFIGGGR